MKQTVAVLGAGSWGSAIALHLAQVGHQVLLWGHNPQHILDIIQNGTNTRYLPGIAFPQNLAPTTDLAYCLEQADIIIIAVPSHGFASLITMFETSIKGLTWITKGIDPVSHQLLSDLVAQRFGNAFPIAILSGPSFAKEVAHFMPTALTLASNNAKYQQQIHQLVHFNNIRVYSSLDLIGIQICGAVKNVLAIACGISDGLGYGANAKAALITRGLAEMSRLGLALGGQAETFLGLAGVGDLVLTCTDNQSRNRRFGLHLGNNMSIIQAEQEIGQVVEGKSNCAQVCFLAERMQIEMPICEQVNALINGHIDVKDVVNNLMKRPPREE